MQETGAPRFPIVFIMGAHRSGTTILYNLIVERLPCRRLTPFHIATFETFLRSGLTQALALRPWLAQRFAAERITDRYFDDLPASLDTPEEYGFVLPGGRLTPQSLGRFQTMLEYLRATDCGDGDCIVLKNPRDFGSAQAVRRLFPASAFIFIHRRPEHVLRSRARELRDLFEHRSEYQAIIEPFYDRLSRSPFAMSALRAAVRCEPGYSLYLATRQALELRSYLHYARSIAPHRDLEIRYEDLCARPAETLMQIMRFLGCATAAPHFALSRLRPPRSDYAAAGPANGVLRRLAPQYYERWGY